MKIYVSLPRKYNKTEVKLIRAYPKKRQRSIKISKVLETEELKKEIEGEK